MEELHYWSIGQLGVELRAGKVSSVEVTRHLLKRIDDFDGRLHAYVTVTAQAALDQAQSADADLRRGLDRGPLHGVPVALKDCIFTADAPTTLGSPVLAQYMPLRDATVTTRLREAGAVILGKLALAEGIYAEHASWRAPPVNPWDRSLWSGASSSGSGVATAAGLCFAALGTDTGGSIRMPSALNAVTGLKPTWGRVSVDGVFPCCPNRDHVGPMARSAQDAAIVLAAIAGEDARDAMSLVDPVDDYVGAAQPAKAAGLTLGVDWSVLSDEVAPELAAALTAAVGQLEKLGLRVREVRYPSADAYLDRQPIETPAGLAMGHEPFFERHAGEYGPLLRGAIERGRMSNGVDLLRVDLERRRFAGALTALLAEVDVLMLPAFMASPPTLQDIASHAPVPSTAKDGAPPDKAANSLGEWSATRSR